ncbi:MAG: Brp/Blh family beta-carotene 15,15'-dioxygenase [Opitutales bacterium]|nr:Brp/Blh family beta-carotene 15,15'-dioxygenase [Opitutales bacterium]
MDCNVLTDRPLPKFPSSRLWFSLPWAIAFSFAILHLTLPPTLVQQAAPWLFLGSMIFLGIPHGAADFLVARKILPRRYFPTPFLVVYSLLVLLILLLWNLGPAICLGLFLLLTAWHWGSAEVYPLPKSSEQSGRPWQAWARGGWVMVLPFALHPAETLTILNAWGIETVPLPPQAAVVGFSGLLLIADLGLSWKAMPRRFRILYGFEVLYLGLMGAILSPLWWITLYFLFFHAWRHTLRIRASFFRPTEKGLLPLLSLATLRYAPLTLLPLLIFVLLILPQQSDWTFRPLPWTGAYIALLAALTVPHSILIRYWDLQGKPEN